MTDGTSAEGPDGGAKIDSSFKELEIVAFMGDLKVIGKAHFGMGQRATSRRASDFIRSFNDTRLTLSDAIIYNTRTNEALERSPFVLINLDKVDLIYARDEAGDFSSRTTVAPS